MKIYNKKGFGWGIFWTLLSISGLILTFLKPDSLFMNIKHVAVYVVILAIGVRQILHALSKSATWRDQVEEQDERNQLVQIKSKAKSFQIVHWSLVVVAAGALIGYIVTRNMVWGGICVATMLWWTFSLIVCGVAEVYYDSRE